MAEAHLLQKAMPTLNKDDAYLIENARQDTGAFTEIYRRYLNPVYYYLLARVRDQQDAEDLTSQVFLEAIEKLHMYRPIKPFAAWLFTIARHRAIDFYRRRRREVPLDADQDQADPAADPLREALARERLSDLVRQVAGLDEEGQELLRLRFAAGLTFAEIAAVLQRKESAVKMAYYRLISRLESQMDKEDA